MGLISRALLLIAAVVCEAAAGAAQSPAAEVQAAAAAAASRIHGQTRRLHSQMGGAARRLTRQAAGGLTGRRLASGQCSWSGSACAMSDAFICTLMDSDPASSFNQVVLAYRACVAITGSTMCESAPDCVWTGEMCEPKAEMEPFGLENCGWLGATVACGTHGADSPQCSAQNSCKSDTEFTVSGDTCTEEPVCAPEPFKYVCGDDFDLEVALAQCTASASTTQATLACMFPSCPVGREMMESQMACSASDETACGQASNCTWHSEQQECNAHFRQLIPAGCIWTSLLEAIGNCNALGQGNCAGDCEWQTSDDCDDDGVFSSESECSLGGLAGYRVLVEAGSEEASRMYNGMAVQENCEAQSSATDCENASVVLMPTNYTGSPDCVLPELPGGSGSGQVGRGASTGAPAVAAVVLLLACGASAHLPSF